MKIEIKFKDHENCLGCPILDIDYSIGWIECILFRQEVSGFVKDENNIKKDDFVRPKKCIEMYGE